MGWPWAARSSSRRRMWIQVLSAGLVAQWRILFAQATKPAQQMRDHAAELRQTAELRESVMEIAEKTVRRTPVGPERAGLVSHGEAPDVRFEDLVEAGFGRIHGIVGGDKRERFSMARSIFTPHVLGSKLDVQHGGVNLRMTHARRCSAGRGDPGAHHISAESMAEPMGVSLRNATAQAMMAVEQGAQSGGRHGPSPLGAFQGNEQGRGIGERSFRVAHSFSSTSMISGGSGITRFLLPLPRTRMWASAS